MYRAHGNPRKVLRPHSADSFSDSARAEAATIFSRDKATGDTERARGSRRPTAGQRILEGGGRRPLGCQPQKHFRIKWEGRHTSPPSTWMSRTMACRCCPAVVLAVHRDSFLDTTSARRTLLHANLLRRILRRVDVGVTLVYFMLCSISCS